MMGIQNNQTGLFSYQVNLDRRIRADNPLRAVMAKVDFEWVRSEVAQCYGYNGNESVDPAVILKLLFLLFFDGIKSERELMRIVPERLDYPLRAVSTRLCPDSRLRCMDRGTDVQGSRCSCHA